MDTTTSSDDGESSDRVSGYRLFDGVIQTPDTRVDDTGHRPTSALGISGGGAFANGGVAAKVQALADLSADYSADGGRALARYFGWLLALVAIVVLTFRQTFSGQGSCLIEAVQFQLSALGTAPTNRFTEVCSVGTVEAALERDILFATVYLLGTGFFLAVWWRESWDTESERNGPGGLILATVAVAALVATAVANGLTLRSIDVTSGNYELDLPSTISTLSWIRWLLTGILLAGLITTVLAWLIRAVAHLFRFVSDRGKPDKYQPPSLEWPSTTYQAPAFGVCLSGGGIRSAAFSLGALSAMEETPVDTKKQSYTAGLLGQADLLASVSGGGYAASAWRIAAGPGPCADNPEDDNNPGRNAEATVDRPQPIIGDPNRESLGRRKRLELKSEQDRPTDELFERLLTRRKYFSSGRGGLPVTAAWVVAQLLWHLGLVLTTIGLIAWPAGRLVRSPIIVFGNKTVEYGRLATPGLLVLSVLGAVLLVRSFTTPGQLRTWTNYAVTALAVIGGGLLVLLVAIPWLVLELMPDLGAILPGGSGATSTVATILTGGVVATVWRMIQAPLKTYAAYLGGALLLVGLILFGGLISLHASQDDRLFSGSWSTWLLSVGGYVALMSVLNPDLWSLHPIYRRRLASTFANKRTKEGWAGLTTKQEHRPLSDYKDAPGPKQVICAVAARKDRSNTGVPVVSMTFEPDMVTVHLGPKSKSVAIETKRYEGLTDGRARDRWLHSVIGVASMSAAAIAPSLGRMSMGSTNALIAALNLRLGVWMPNPLYMRGRRAGTQMYSMFKEILGIYDLSDPNLYVTDGGHWENLALVELIRRRTKVIIAVDASADEPYTFSCLHEAVELALLECRADIVFRPGELDAMQPDGTSRPVKNWAIADINYLNEANEVTGTGRLLFVKAQASQAMPLDILRYSKEDPDFPNYSTANQFLSEAEFLNLAILGRQSMIKALEDQKTWLFSGQAVTNDGDESEPTSPTSTDSDGTNGQRSPRPPTTRVNPTAIAPMPSPTVAKSAAGARGAQATAGRSETVDIDLTEPDFEVYDLPDARDAPTAPAFDLKADASTAEA